MRQLILHIGNHKTGTTALQDWLVTNRDVLASRGITYLTPPGERHAHGYLAYVDPKEIFPKGYKLDKPKQFAEALAEAPGNRVIVSSENFSFFFEQRSINALARAVAPHFDVFRVVCYLRRQDRHAVSHHAEGARPERVPEGILWGHGFFALPPVNPLQRLYLNYDQRIAKWERAFGQDCMVLRVYEPEMLVGGDVVVDFCETLGIDRSGCVEAPRSNQSLDRAKIRLGHIIATQTDDAEVAKALMWYTKGGTTPLLPARANAEAFLKPYLESNAALNARYRLTERPTLFNDDFSDLPKRPSMEWSDEDFNQIVTALVRHYVAAFSSRSTAQPDDLREAVIALAPKRPRRALRLLEVALSQLPGSPPLLQMKERLLARLQGEDRDKDFDLSDLRDLPLTPPPPKE